MIIGLILYAIIILIPICIYIAIIIPIAIFIFMGGSTSVEMIDDLIAAIRRIPE